MTSEEMAKKVERLSKEGRDILDDICMELQDSCPFMDEDGNLRDDCDCVGCIVKWLESEENGE